MNFVDVLLILSFFLFAFYLFVKTRQTYWSKRKVPYLKPKRFLLGNFGETLFDGIPLVKVHEKMYNELSPYKFGGYFRFLKPVLLIRDPELIKNICTKDFEYFTDRFDNVVDKNDVLALHLFNLQGQSWKILRSKLTSTFTSGKMKTMYSLMKESTLELIKMIDKMNEDGELIETKELMARYTTDVISSCAFGLQSNSQKNPNSIFRQMGKKALNFSFRNLIINILEQIFPQLKKILGLSFFERSVTEFFKSIVTNTIKYREENNINRNDFIDLLIQLKKNEIINFENNPDTDTTIEFTDDLLTAQCFLFYFAGFETSSGTLTFVLYELAKHEDIQNKLSNEIEKIMDEDKELSYESLQKMTYLEQIISETLRMYPILPFLMRVCNKNYLLDDSVNIEKGIRIIVPVMGLHYDPQYYENPLEFNPENFSKDAKNRRHRYVYLPFGEGPRNCIGMRFGLMQVKLGLAIIIKNYKICVSSKMDGTFKFRKLAFFTETEGGMWLTFTKRI